MIPWWWSWLLTAVGVTGLWLAGSRKRWGWAIGIGAQLLWIGYALTTEQYGFLASALAYGTVYVRNWRAWRSPAEDLDRQLVAQRAFQAGQKDLWDRIMAPQAPTRFK